jgi:hypothetical protein
MSRSRHESWRVIWRIYHVLIVSASAFFLTVHPIYAQSVHPMHPTLLRPGERFATRARLSVSQSVLTIDASKGQRILTVPQRPRHFATMEDFLKFCQTTLGGKAVRKSGKLVAVLGRSVILGKPASVDPATHAVIEQRDPILAIIGGATRSVVIGAKTYDLRTPTVGNQNGARRIRHDSVELVAMAPGNTSVQLLAMAPSSVNHCFSSSPPNCTNNTSFQLNLAIFAEVGSTTTQTQGGFQQSSHFCWLNGWIPWVCTTSTGSNNLHITNTYFTPTFFQEGSGRNVTSLTVMEWAVGTNLGIVGSISGVCGTHDGVVFTAAGHTMGC